MSNPTEQTGRAPVINATIQGGLLTMPDGRSIDLAKVQTALNFGFQETGDPELMHACDQMAKITGVEQGPSGELVPAAAPVQASTSGAGDLPGTKLVEVRLAALTRVEYMEVVEVPADITPAELDQLVNDRYRLVDGGAYHGDPEYWARATCEAVDTAMPNAVPSVMAFRTAHGLQIERADAESQEYPRARSEA